MKNYDNRLGQTRYNHEDDLMKIVKYNNSNDILVEFQDEHKSVVHTKYCHFIKGCVRNPYGTKIFGVAMLGNKHHAWVGNKATKEYGVWKRMLQRCYDKNYQSVQKTYEDAVCCEEWLLFDNFYEWLHSQENFNKWLNGYRWALDKDILVKGNKMYNLDTCRLVPQNVNSLFTKRNADRGELPIGVHEQLGRYLSTCCNPLVNEQVYLGSFDAPTQAFEVYKEYKEDIIKQVAQKEFDAGNITEQCYNAMMSYEVEITD